MLISIFRYHVLTGVTSFNFGCNSKTDSGIKWDFILLFPNFNCNILREATTERIYKSFPLPNQKVDNKAYHTRKVL